MGMNKEDSRKAQRKIENLKQAADSRIVHKDTDIAITGLACRFPGAKDYREFADNLLKGVNSIKEIPPSRWDVNEYYSPDFSEPNKSISKWCGMVENIDRFDNLFFNISPREANNMDPQQRLMLEETWHCIEDSGVPLTQLQQKITSVYVGVMAIDYHQECAAPGVITDSYTGQGNFGCILANRISYLFGFQGESISIDAACAASLVAIHRARSSLIMRESDYSLAGGVSLNFHPWKYISFSKSRMLSPDGQCKTFDINANGYVPGEGVGVILLQRLEDAILDGNHIYGVIKGSAVGHGGKTESLTAPRVEAQKKVILAAYKNAGIEADTINYLEAHGTGTSLGDPIEIEALTQAFREYTQNEQFCKIGSVKTNIGHLEAAAGIAGVIKVLTMMRHRKVPPTLNVKKLNPIINFKDSPFIVATEASDWQRIKPGVPLRSGVSSFGFGGVNSHIVLEEYAENPVAEDNETALNQLFVLSAKSKPSIKNLIDEWKLFVNSQTFSQYSLNDICTTLKLGRESFPYRCGAHVHSKEELKSFLQKAVPYIPKQNKKYWCLRIGDFSFNDLKQLQAYLQRFELLRHNLKVVEKCFLNMKGIKGDLEDFHHEHWTESTKPLYSFMVAYAGICTLIDLGFRPDVVTGEKAGVLVGLVLSGIMNLEDALAVLSNHKKLQEIEFARPTIPYYDSILKTTVMPFHFDENYLRLLLDELGRKNKLLGQVLVDGILYIQEKGVQPDQGHQQQTRLGHLLVKNGVITEKQLENALAKQKKTHDLLGAIIVGKKYCTPDELTSSLRQQDILRYYVHEVFSQYVDKARLLNTSQFTFKKYLEEWDVVLKKAGKEFLQLLYDDQLLSQKEGGLRNEKLLMMIIIMSCLRRLNEKWKLTEKCSVEEKRFYELIDLVTDEVMPKEGLVELLLSDNPDYAAIAHTLNKRQVHRSLSNSYRYITRSSSDIQGIEDVSSWLIEAMEIKNILPSDSMAYLPIDNIAFWEIGKFNEPVPFEGSVHLKMGQNLCELFTNSLLELWLDGVDIKWEKISQEGSYKKVVLPVYPFDRRSFWLHSKDSGQEFKEKDREKKTKLQQVEQKGRHYYRRNFSVKDPIIRDHVITGKPIVPGASMIELGLEAGQKASNRTINTVRNILIQTPGIVEKELTLEVEIALEKNRFIVKKDADTLCSGEFETTGGQPFPSPDLSHSPENQARDISGLYQSLSGAGYQYGNGLKVIAGMWKSERRFLFELKKLPDEEGQITSLNPGILDGVFQAALAVEYYLEGMTPNDNTLYVPYFIKSLTLTGETGNNCFVCIDRADIQKKGQDLNVQFRVYDTSGKGVLWIQDMIFKQVSNQFLTPPSQQTLPKSLTAKGQDLNKEHHEAYYYKPVWNKHTLINPEDHTPRRTAILLRDGSNLSAQLSQEIASKYQRAFLINKEQDYKEQSYVEAIQNIAKQMNGSSEQYDIYHLWAYEPQTLPIVAPQDLMEKQEKGVKSLLFLAKALTRLRLKNRVKIIVGTHNIHVIEPQDKGEGYCFGSLLGSAKTIMMENPRIRVKMVDFGNDNLPLSKKVHLLLDEGISSEQVEIVAYRQEGRYVRTLEPFSFSGNHHVPGNHPVLKDKGVYLLIGGAGGIGMKVAGMIAKQVKPRLILIGRSPLSSEKRLQMEQLQANGAEVIYIQGDVTNPTHMGKLLRIIKSRYGAINGVIQAGGILEDKLLTSKDWESFQRVMASKVQGTWIINQLTRKEPLDFFVVFSSIVSLLGNIGQVDYAAANSFLDSFIHYRARNNYPGKSLSINWALWADGGMGLDDRVKVSFENRGLPPISSRTGLRALAQVIQYEQQQPCQLAVLGQKVMKF